MVPYGSSDTLNTHCSEGHCRRAPKRNNWVQSKVIAKCQIYLKLNRPIIWW